MTVHLAARIGEPVDHPWVGVQVTGPHGLSPDDVRRPIVEVIQAEIARLPEFRAELIRGRHPVC